MLRLFSHGRGYEREGEEHSAISEMKMAEYERLQKVIKQLQAEVQQAKQS